MSLDIIRLWHERARPAPTDADFNVQLGCHFEEIGEMIAVIGTDDVETQHYVNRALVSVLKLAEHLKSGGVVSVTDRKEFLDSLCDQVVTGVGVGHCAKVNVVEGVNRVNTSNWSKYDVDGQPIFHANGKIMKGPRYQPPVLEGLY